MDANVGISNTDVNAGANVSPGVNIGSGSQSVNSGVTCQGNATCSKQMPGFSQQNIQDLREWILNGAEAPIILN